MFGLVQRRGLLHLCDWNLSSRSRDSSLKVQATSWFLDFFFWLSTAVGLKAVDWHLKAPVGTLYTVGFSVSGIVQRGKQGRIRATKVLIVRLETKPKIPNSTFLTRNNRPHSVQNKLLEISTAEVILAHWLTDFYVIISICIFNLHSSKCIIINILLRKSLPTNPTPALNVKFAPQVNRFSQDMFCFLNGGWLSQEMVKVRG